MKVRDDEGRIRPCYEDIVPIVDKIQDKEPKRIDQFPVESQKGFSGDNRLYGRGAENQWVSAVKKSETWNKQNGPMHPMYQWLSECFIYLCPPTLLSGHILFSSVTSLVPRTPNAVAGRY